LLCGRSSGIPKKEEQEKKQKQQQQAVAVTGGSATVPQTTILFLFPLGKKVNKHMRSCPCILD
jgi:hypothetical protein